MLETMRIFDNSKKIKFGGIRMNKNKVVEVLEKYIGTENRNFLNGKITKVGTNDCKLSEDGGSVYGIAVRLENNEIEEFFKKHNEKKIRYENWKSIGDNFYPLYWGKDKNIGSRLVAHTKSYDGTGSLQLNKAVDFKDRECIYGAVLCLKSAEIEKKLHSDYPDILKTKKKK